MELLPIAIQALADAIFAFVIASLGQSPFGESIQKLLSGDPAKLAFQRAIAAAYAALSRNYVNSARRLFDDEFILHNRQVKQELSKILSRTNKPEPQRLVDLWEQQFFTLPDESHRELLTASSYFISMLQLECEAQETLRPVFDSRGIEKLHEIAESEERNTQLLEDIRNDIRELLIEGNKYIQRLLSAGEQAIEFRPNIAHRLPPRPDFIGRSDKRATILSCLDPDSRAYLVVIVGLGGMGKSALACEIAHVCKERGLFDLIIWTTAQEKLLNERGNGIEEIEPDVQVLEDILELVGRAAGQPLPDQMPLLEKKRTIRDIMCKLRCLLIVDNFETIRDESVNQFLKLQIPSPSKAIVTSRIQLGTGEFVPLTGLSLDETRGLIDSLANPLNPGYNLASYLALVKKAWEWSGGNPLAIKWLLGQADSSGTKSAEIIESLPDVAEEEMLSFCFDGLYRKLELYEKICLQALTVFRSSVSRDALAAISDLRIAIVNAAVAALRQKSLVEVDYTDNLEERYRLLPLTRRYARSKGLSIKDYKIDDYFARAVYYYCNFITRHRLDYEILEPEIDNIITLLDWCISQGRHKEIVEIVEDFSIHLGILGLDTDRVKYAEIAAQSALTLGLEERSMWIHAFDIGWIILNQGRYDEATKLYSHLLEKAKDNGYLRVAALSYRNLALMKRRQYQESPVEERSELLLDQARELAQLSLDYWLQCGDEYWIAVTLGTLGTIALQQGSLEDATRQYTTAMALDEKNGNKEGIALAKSNLGRVAIKQKHYRKALDLIGEALEIDRSLKRIQGIASGLQRQAYIYDRLGDFARARDALQEAAPLFRQRGSMTRFREAQNQIALIERKIRGEELGPIY